MVFKLKKHEYLIEVHYDYKDGLCDMASCFVIRAVPVNKKQALSIAKILFPTGKNIKIASITNCYD